MRVKSGVDTRRKHKKVLKLASGYWMTRHKQFKKAKEAVLHAGEYAFAGRKLKKRDFRTLWIIRLNAALRELGLTYSKFINLLSTKKIGLDYYVRFYLFYTYPDKIETSDEQIVIYL